MVVFRRGLALLACAPLFAVSPARAQAPGMCRVVNVDFTPGGIAASSEGPEIAPQIVAWIETPAGQYVDTIYITQKTGRHGIGNRPGRFDFNSGPLWPYGRRVTVLPVWSHRHKSVFPQLEFQGGNDSALSNSSSVSSRETYFCRPLLKSENQWDTGTCASTVYTDKGVFGSATTGYPPRSDINPLAEDSASVAMFKAMNPFDAVSQATPHIGLASQMSWPIPPDLATGDYVLFVEVSLERDFNAAYPEGRYPSPEVPYGDYGVPYRGQPSVIYRVPFTVSDVETFATTDTYIGHGDPDGGATLYPPDATITTDTPDSGASRLRLISRDGELFRLRVDAHPERDFVGPSVPGQMAVSDPSATGATLSFVAPGDDGAIGKVQGYEVRYLAGDVPITEANFGSANELRFAVDIAPAGQIQALAIKDLLPETEYTVAVRAFDECRNTSSIAVTTFTTAARQTGEVDACFIATAAYGSLLANDVEMLRRFRDTLLKRSVLGELAVEAYYTFGPSVAGVVGESDLLRSTARDLLTPIVDRVRQLRW